VTGLLLALERLTVDPMMRQWLEWPTNPLAILPEGAFILSCRASDWARRRLLHAVLLSALTVPEVRLIVHGFPWQAGDLQLLFGVERMVIANGPTIATGGLALGVVILTACRAESSAALASRFMRRDARAIEQLALLGRGEALVLARDEPLFSYWPGIAEAE
jgi:hypothetical protein